MESCDFSSKKNRFFFAKNHYSKRYLLARFCDYALLLIDDNATGKNPWQENFFIVKYSPRLFFAWRNMTKSKKKRKKKERERELPYSINSINKRIWWTDFKINTGVDKFCTHRCNHCYCSIREPVQWRLSEQALNLSNIIERMQRPWTAPQFDFTGFSSKSTRKLYTNRYNCTIVPRYRVVRTLFTLLFILSIHISQPFPFWERLRRRNFEIEFFEG